MASNLLIRLEDLTTNPTPRVPVCLCLDTSGSMNAVEGEATRTGRTTIVDGKEWNVVTGGTTRIQLLTRGVTKFYEAIRSDEIAEASAEISIVSFDDTARCLEDFANIYRQDQNPTFKTGNLTAMGEGVNLAMDMLEQRKKEYADAGVDYYQPWLVLMTDGSPNGDRNELERAIARVSEAVKAKKLTVFALAVGSGADKRVLSRFTPGQEPLQLNGIEFEKFFAWLSQSVVRASQSMGEPITLDLTDVKKGWDTL